MSPYSCNQHRKRVRQTNQILPYRVGCREIAGYKEVMIKGERRDREVPRYRRGISGYGSLGKQKHEEVDTVRKWEL